MRLIAATISAMVCVTPVLAADIVYEEPPVPVAIVAAPTWTGFYVGIQGGAAFNTQDPDKFGISSSFGSDNPIFVSANPTVATQSSINDFFTSNSASASGTSFLGGAHVGYDYQINQFVLGALLDINGLDVSKTQAARTDDSGSFTAERSLDFLATARVIAGYAITPSFLAYATGGLAYGKVDYSFDTDSPLVLGTPNANSIAGSLQVFEDEDEIGYSVGGGLDILVIQNISLGAEYLYTNLGGSSSARLSGGRFDGNGRRGQDLDGYTDLSSDDFDFHTVTAKLSYRFN